MYSLVFIICSNLTTDCTTGSVEVIFTSRAACEEAVVLLYDLDAENRLVDVMAHECVSWGDPA